MAKPRPDPSPLENYVPLIFIFFTAFLLRILYWILLKNNYLFYDHPGGDVLYYQQWAKEIARGNWVGSETFWGLPLYPYFLAVLERWSVGNLFFIRLAHIFLGSLNCVLVYLIARRIFSKEVALLSGSLTAVSFTSIHYDWLVLPVPLLIFLALVIVLAFSNHDKITTWHGWGCLGLLIGITALGDGKILIFALLTISYLLVQDRPLTRDKALKTLLPMMVGIMLVLGLTGLRNKLVGGDWIWTSAQSGLSFYVGNNPKATGVFENPDFIRPTHGGQDEDQVIAAETLAKRKLTPAQVVWFWRGQGFAFIKNDPLDYLRLLARKFRLFFTETEYAYDIDLLLQRDWKQRFDVNPFLLICPLAFLGIILTRRNRPRGSSRREPLGLREEPLGLRKETDYINIMIASQLVFTLIFFLTDRHRATILPFLIIYESYTFLWFIGQLRLKRFNPVWMMMGLLIVFVALFPPRSMSEKEFAFYRFIKTAAVYERKEDFANAREQYFQALRLRPSDTNAMYNLANTYALTGQWALARDHYEKILALDPRHVDALYNLGFVQQKEGAYARSFTTFERLLELQPNSPDALFQAGGLARRLGDCASSKIYFKHLIQIKPNLSPDLQAMIDSCHP